ncbi:MAG: type II toxin-antitoxin system VapC family toxin [Acidobacteria bacterium]|nr:type II toxin-antitoxin system VapC family toxin [Acidobacteriota bacterium]
MIFVDTGAWAAFFVPRDPLHEVAVRWMRENREPLITIDYVLHEFLTLVKRRVGVAAAIEAGGKLWEVADIREALQVFRSHRDKGWSFTDCTSFAVMRRLRILQAFAFDRHFSQMAGIQRVP